MRSNSKCRQNCKQCRSYLGLHCLPQPISLKIKDPYGSFDYFQLGEESQYLAKMMEEIQNTYSSRMRDSWQILCPQIGKNQYEIGYHMSL